MDNKKYIVYCHTNKINGKKYIGITSRKPELRWLNGKGYSRKNHQTKFANAINKYGWDNFSHDILEKELSFKKAAEKEMYYIKIYDTFKNGYNMTLGGGGNLGRIVSKETREKIGISSKGNQYCLERKQSIEEKMKRAESLKGHVCSIETREKISRANRGRKMPNEVKEKCRLSHIGKKKTLDSKLKLSKPIIQFDLNGNFLKEYYSCREAARQLLIPRSNIIDCLKGRLCQTHGYKFEYKEA